MLYYVVKTGDDRFDLRQSRFKDQLAAGNEHPHDLMASGFDREGMNKVIDQYFLRDTDASAMFDPVAK